MQNLRRYPPLIACISGVMGIVLWSTAMTERERATLIQSEPLPFDCADLTTAARRENRHVTVQKYWFGKHFAVQKYKNSTDYRAVYVPVYSADITREATGANIHLLACFKNALNDNELAQALAVKNLTGFIWQTSPVPNEVEQQLNSTYPQFDLKNCLVINLHEKLPTFYKAQQYFLMSGIALVLALGLAACLADQYWQQYQRSSTDSSDKDAYAEQPEQDRSGVSVNQRLRRSASRAKPVLNLYAIPISVVCYALMNTGIVGSEIALLGMVASLVLALLAGCGVFNKIIPFQEHQHLPVEPEELPNPVRAHFNQHTPEFLHLGFEFAGDAQSCVVSGMFMRRFLSSDGTSLASLTAGASTIAYDFLSITSDGMLLETTTTDVKLFEDPSLPRLFQTVTDSITTAFEAHQMLILDYTEDSGAEVITLHPDNLLAAIRYDYLITNWVLYKKGFIQDRPPRLARFNKGAC